MASPVKRALACALLLAALFAGASSARAATVPYQRGMTLADWGHDAYRPKPTVRELKRLRKLGVDTVTILAVWTQSNLHSADIAPHGVAVQDKRLIAAIRAAHRLHMRVLLRPYVDLLDGNWRGQIKPADYEAWFTNYDKFILRYAKLAQRQRVEGFCVGSEMGSLSVNYPKHWRALVAGVRQRFSGFVTYQANWGDAEIPYISWWDAVDVISVSAYYELAKSFGYSADDLVASWGPTYDQLQAISASVGRPVMFGEIGYRSVKGSAMEPWNTTSQLPRDAQDQAISYLAAFRVWYRAPFFRGFEWWYSSPHATASRYPGGDHVPSGPARAVLSEWYHTRP
jgi:glycosyl hydrolase family 113